MLCIRILGTVKTLQLITSEPHPSWTTDAYKEVFTNDEWTIWNQRLTEAYEHQCSVLAIFERRPYPHPALRSLKDEACLGRGGMCDLFGGQERV